eukprot:TRINITY_DN7504_c0_g1_i1.p1 TRINITY_DN7504_c0_g1~~TRINITY_DN7504_c0_g1_i1.p1  ORF type:complete len:609 (-),score=145.58 TRINITY_DN7504_c0_g1_i1:62-1888(-)
MNFGGKRKPRATPANLEWNSVERLWYTTGGSMDGVVPPEFEELDVKLKEMQNAFSLLCKLGKKQQKYITNHNQTGLAVSSHLIELASVSKDIGLFSSTLQNLGDAQMACENSRIEIRNKIQTRFIQPVDTLTHAFVNPARDAKKSWEAIKKDDLGISKSLQNVIAEAATPSGDPLKLYQLYYNSRLSQTREESKYNEAASALLEATWMRDFKFITFCIDLMIEQHDVTLSTYSSLNHLKALEEDIMKQIASGIVISENKKRAKAEEEEKRKADAQENKYDALVEILSQPDLCLMNSVCVTAGSEQEEILRTIIKILDAHSKTMPIIKQSITNEVGATQNPATLFRGNSTATKLMSAFTKMTGRAYLTNVIKPFVDEICTSTISCEVDSSKISAGEDVETNMMNLLSYCQTFLDAIMGSLDACPLPFRDMMQHLQSEVMKRFPTAGYIAVAGFIFLRFFCPAISAPESQEVVTPAQISPKARRTFVLISKVIQCLANGAKFGQKEAFMLPCNSFIETNQQACNNFLAALSTIPPQQEDYKMCSLEEAKAIHLPILQCKIVQNLDLITSSLISYKNQNLVEPLISILGDLEYYTGDINVEIISSKPPKKK